MPGKRILTIQYSQSGQLTEVANNFMQPLESASEITIRNLILKPIPAYSFPWSLWQFLNILPETVRLVPPALEPFQLDHEKPFDLIVLFYQVWYLSPSPPVTAFLKSDEGRRLLKGRPVVTVVVCRNMWLTAQQTVKRLLQEAGAHLRDNVALTDRAPTWKTLITTPRWMMTGKRGPWLGLPRAGVSLADATGATRFGDAIKLALKNGDLERHTKPMLSGLGAVTVNPSIILSERIAYRGFRVWSAAIMRAGTIGPWARHAMLFAFAIWLVVAILFILPVSSFVRQIIRLFMRGRLDSMQRYYEQPSGSSRHLNQSR
ncbi:dialkylrecorsinol condensing enzyme [Burkholderia sp. TSV86]|nr:dialkylrecorsinol condensing enzyme [Burkholderia sp. TSV86]